MAIHVIKKCLYPGITTSQLDEAAAEMAITMTTIHPDYEKLASRIAISNLHKQTKDKFSGKYYEYIIYRKRYVKTYAYKCYNES